MYAQSVRMVYIQSDPEKNAEEAKASRVWSSCRYRHLEMGFCRWYSLDPFVISENLKTFVRIHTGKHNHSGSTYIVLKV